MIGADGLHSNVRRLILGDDAGHTQFLGGYLTVLSAPKTLAREGEMVVHVGAGRLAGIYTARPLDDARALFMFREKEQLQYHYRDAVRQKELLRRAFTGIHATVDCWLDELDCTPAFYFDSITQLQLAGHLVARSGDADR